MAEPRESWWARRPWLAAVLLYLPFCLPALAHFAFPGDGRVPTGFVQYDQASYMAMAREHFDHGFTLLYGLPFSPDPDTPRLYAQPQSLFLGLLREITGAEPGVLFFIFGVVSGLVFFRLAIAVWFERLQRTDAAAALGLPLMLWGGGLLALAGSLAALSEGSFTPEGVFRFDPLDGWWFLNLGRNVWYALEAYYHAIAFAVLLTLLRRRYGLALLLVALLSASHPFTGAQFALIYLGFAALETLLRAPARPSLLYVAGAAAVLALHLVYYLWFIPSHSVEQRQLVEQWLAETPLSLPGGLLAYALVLPFAITAVWQGALRAPGSRLFLVMAAVTFGLMKHDLILEAHQPLHFSRGYLWSALLLLGAPALYAFLRFLLTRWRGAVRALAVFLLIGLFAFDNAVWFGWRTKEQVDGFTQFLLRPAQWAVLQELQRPDYAGHLVVSTDLEVGYLVTAYTPLRSWMSHAASTPSVAENKAELERWLATGEEPPRWRGRDLAIVIRVDEAAQGTVAFLQSKSAQALPLPSASPAFLVFRLAAQERL